MKTSYLNHDNQSVNIPNTYLVIILTVHIVVYCIKNRSKSSRSAQTHCPRSIFSDTL